MSIFKLNAGFALALLAGTWPMASAHAADLDPGYADVPAPITQQMVTFGSGWYVRGDMGATEDYKTDADKSSKYKINPTIKRSSDLGYDLSLGGGYAFTNSIRADVTVDFLRPVRTDGSNIQFGQKYNFGSGLNQYGALVNGYYDIGTWSIVTPYVGVGVGTVFGNAKANDYSNNLESYVSYYNFAWALMAGLAFDVYPHVKIDVGYRYLNAGTVLNTKASYNEIRAGLRYMIDN